MIATAVISGLTLTGATMLVQAKNSSTNDALSVNKSSITLEKAVSIAQKAVMGTPAKAEFSTDDGTAIWEVEIVDKNQQVYDIEIDAMTGTVLKHVTDEDDDDDDDGKGGGKEEND